MYVTRTIIHGGDRLHTAPPPPDCQTPRPRGLSLEIFHIRNALGSRLTQAIQVECIGGFDLIIFTETKINDQDHCCIRMGYDVVVPPTRITVEDSAQGECAWSSGTDTRDGE